MKQGFKRTAGLSAVAASFRNSSCTRPAVSGVYQRLFSDRLSPTPEFASGTSWCSSSPPSSGGTCGRSVGSCAVCGFS